MTTSLILASGSPFRLSLLRQAGYSVAAVPSGVAEPELQSGPEIEPALRALAERKALAVCDQGHTGLILGADTVSLAGQTILGKPVDRRDARRMLAALSGSEHSVLTGWCLLRARDRLAVSGVERTRLWMRSWNDAEIEAYLDSGEWQGKCGGYGLELPHDPFVARIEGSAANVIGLPLERLAAVLAEFPTLALERD